MRRREYMSTRDTKSVGQRKGRGKEIGGVRGVRRWVRKGEGIRDTIL